MSVEQQIACILQSTHRQIVKMPRHEQESRTYRPTINIKAVHSANVTRYVLARWRANVHQSFV